MYHEEEKNAISARYTYDWLEKNTVTVCMCTDAAAALSDIYSSHVSGKQARMKNDQTGFGKNNIGVLQAEHNQEMPFFASSPSWLHATDEFQVKFSTSLF